MTTEAPNSSARAERRPVRLAYLVSHPIQYQAPLLRRIASEPDIDLTVFFGSDFSVRGYKDEGFGVEVAWDTPLIEGYKHHFLKPLRDNGTVSATSPISRGIYSSLCGPDGLAAFDALWVHGYASVNALQGILAANALHIPVLLRAESWLRDRERSPFKLAAKNFCFRILGRMIAATLPIGTLNAEYWLHYFGEDMPQFLMPYAVDNDYFARKTTGAVPHEAELRASLQLDADRPVILFASKLQKRKNCMDLIEAYAEFLKSDSATTPYLVIVGDGEERARLEAFCRDAALTDVRFAGFQNQSVLPRYFQLADVFVLPSRHEPWGLIVNEAMAAGCACIVSDDVGAHTDLITDGRPNEIAGFVFPTGNVPALAAALQRLFNEPGTAAAMGLRAAERIRTWSFEQDVIGLRAALEHTTRRLRA
jgi:glycosyltransferase involved in cell wall biosynthesis